MDRPLELETREHTEGDKAVTRETDERLQPGEGLRQPELGSLQYRQREEMQAVFRRQVTRSW